MNLGGITYIDGDDELIKADFNLRRLQTQLFGPPPENTKGSKHKQNKKEHTKEESNDNQTKEESNDNQTKEEINDN